MNRADKRKFHYIYQVTRNDGHYYIGMHSTDDLNDGYFGSGKLLWFSIRKHGKEAHSKKVLEFLPTREAVKAREQEIVNEERISDPLCMNLRLGGGGGGGFILEHQQKGGKEKHKNFSTEQKFAAFSRIGKLGGAISGKLVGPKTIHHATAAAASEAANEKRKQTFAERGHMQGEKNSQFGSCWVTDGVKPVKIKKEQLDEFLSKGYRRGRS